MLATHFYLDRSTKVSRLLILSVLILEWAGSGFNSCHAVRNLRVCGRLVIELWTMVVVRWLGGAKRLVSNVSAESSAAYSPRSCETNRITHPAWL